MIFHTNKDNRKVQSGFRGRVSLLEPDISQGNCSIIVNDLTESDSGSYRFKVILPEANEKKATVSVKGLIQKPTVMIPVSLKEGQQTTLTCTAPGLCSGSDPEITWMWRGRGEKDSHITGNITAFKTENLTAVTWRHSSTLTFNFSAEHHSTNVTCKIIFRNNITTEETVTLSETSFPKILKSSGCEVQSEVLTCVCISEGFPLPTINWSLLKNHDEYSIITMVSKHKVNSTVTLTVNDHSDAAVECVSSNADPGLSLQSDWPCDQEAADRGAEAAEQSVPDGDVVPKEVEYSDIDFSKCNRTRAEATQETTEAEYAEIKREITVEREDNGGEEGEMLEANEEEVAMTGEDKETKQCLSAEKEEGEDMAVYSNGETDCLIHRIKMFVLIWATVLFAVRSSNASKVASPQEIPAEAGLCVVVPCYVPESGFPVESAAWFKCEPECTDSGNILLLNNTSPNAQSGFRGRVSLLEPELSHRNCSIIINDLSQSDSGLYQLLILNGTMKEFTSQNVTITVKDLNQKPTVMIPPLTEGQQTTLTCTAPGLCSGSDPEITWTWRGRGEKDSHITGNITAFKTENLTTVSKRHSSTLTFNSSAEHHGTDVTCKVSFRNNITTEETVTLNVTYVKEPEISGNTAVKEGDTLNLTCSVDSFPPIVITWTKTDLNKKLSNETEIDPKSNTGTTTLVISNVTAQHSGQYNCKAKHLDNILMKEVNITVISYPEILNSSGCINQLEVLTCVCISQGFPLPTIKWPLLKKLTEYSVITKVSHHTVNSTVILAAKDQSNTAVECVSSSGNGEVKRDLRVEQKEAEGNCSP
ncbi:uncharacterized protein ABDE67_005914 [Symphorus nematophorus]